VDDEMREVGVDEVGELVVRGDQVSPGYFRDPDRTQEAWRGGWFHTGDLMRRDADGYFYIVERKKDIIITGGENVYPRDVEVALEAHPGVQEVAVIGIPDPVWIEQVSAVIVVKEDMSLTEGELIEYCQSRLSGFKRPRRIFFVNELPKTVSGKVQKHELRRIVAEEP
jgi:acyl-CoA synthetase (AMP-forming)/AMP-acid ligase II